MKRKRRKRSASRQVTLDERRRQKKLRLGSTARVADRSFIRQLRNEDRIGPSIATAKNATLSESAKALLLVDRIKGLFDIKRRGDFLTLHQEPGPQTVRALAEFISDMWPRDFRPSNEGSETDGFRLLFWGHHTPHSISATITRASLYADQILVVNPFTDPLLYHPQSSPLVNPIAFTGWYALLAVFMLTLEPWLRAGIVGLVENPASFDVELFNRFKKLGIARVERNPGLSDLVNDETLSETYAEMLVQLPETARASFLGKLPLKRRVAVTSKVNEMLSQDPIRASIPIVPRREARMTNIGTGLSYEHASVLAAAHGAHLFTSNTTIGRILQSETRELVAPFQQAANAISGMKMSFLNDVPVDFALEMRANGKLRDFRQYVCGIAKSVSFRDPSKAFSPIAPREFSERFEAEYARYRDDWNDIQRKLAITSFGVLPAGAGVAIALTTGAFPILGTLAASQATALVSSIFDRRKLERQPLGVMLRLDRR